MTTYTCPTCNQTWSMGPTRDMQVCDCPKCLQRQIEASPFLDAILLARDLHDAQERHRYLHQAISKEEYTVCQTLGRAMGYPWYKDDQKNFPGATEANGVCTGEHVPVTIAEEAADHILALTERIHQLQEELDTQQSYYAIRLELIQERAKQAYPADIRSEIQNICALGYIPS